MQMIYQIKGLIMLYMNPELYEIPSRICTWNNEVNYLSLWSNKAKKENK